MNSKSRSDNPVLFSILIGIYLSISFVNCQTPSPDVFSVPVSSPSCLNVRSNDPNTGATISSVTNGTYGLAFINQPAFFLMNDTATVLVEAEDYIQNGFEDTSNQYYYDTSGINWSAGTELGGQVGSAMRVPNGGGNGFSTGSDKWGIAMVYNVVFRTSGSYTMYVRGRALSSSTYWRDDSCHFLWRNPKTNALNFMTFYSPISGFVNSGYNWQNAFWKMDVTDEMLLTVIKVYIALLDDGLLVDRWALSLTSSFTGSTQGGTANSEVTCPTGQILYIPALGYTGLDILNYTTSGGTAKVSLYVGVPVPSPSPSPTRSPTPSPSVTPSTSPSRTPSSSASPSMSPSKSATPSISESPSQTPSPSVSRTPSVTPSPSATSSVTPSASVSSSPGASQSVTPSITPSNTPSPSVTPTPSNSPSETPSTTPSQSITPTPSPSQSPSSTPSPSVTPSSSPSASVTPSISSSPSVTPSVTPSGSPSPISQLGAESGSGGGSPTTYVAIGVALGVALCAGMGVTAFIVVRRRSAGDRDDLEMSSLLMTPVLPASDEKLRALEQILLADGYRLVKATVKYTQITEADKLASWLVTVFEYNGLTMDLIKSLIAREVNVAQHAGSLMRANSMASKMMKSLSGLIAKPFIKSLFTEMVEYICKNPIEDGASFEVDPVKVPTGETLEKNQKRLMEYCNKFLHRILESVEQAPLEFRQICNALQRRVCLKFPENSQLCVGGFLFLRVFCPAIVAPSGFGVIATAPNPTAQRGLTLIAKILQNLANNVMFGSKESFLIWTNPFIESNLRKCQDYFDMMATIPQHGMPVMTDIQASQRDQCLNNIYKHLKVLYPKMKEKYAGKDFFDHFVNDIAKDDLNKASVIFEQKSPRDAVTEEE